MKKMKKIVAAAMAMMTLSTAAAVTGTVAWFTSSNIVTANGMSLQADTEQGLNISNENKTEWKESATASHTGIVSNEQAKFIPTTTTNGSTWLHGNSDDRNNSDAVGELETLTISFADGIGKVNKNGSSINGKNVYLLNIFHLRSSTPTVINAEKLYVNSLVASGTTADADLDLCFRVLIKSEDGDVLIFAPFEDAVDEKAPVEDGCFGENIKNVELSSNVAIPAASDVSTDDTYEISVYCYFEGKDSNCKSANITTNLNTLSIECKFGTETIA